jgi:hypothetical protein
MHYIRFLRPPQCDVSKKTVDISAVVAVETDLSDALLSKDVLLVADVVEANSPHRVLHSQHITWQATSRALKFTVQCPSRFMARPVNLRVASQGTEGSSDFAGTKILDVWSSEFRLADKQRSEPLVERRMQLANKSTLRIWEETGESMARHIW